MDIKSSIVEKRMESIRNRNTEEKKVYDYILGEIQREEKGTNWKGEVSAITIVKKFVNSLKETMTKLPSDSPTIAEYEFEIALVEPFLPKLVSEQDLRGFITNLVAEQPDQNKGHYMKFIKGSYGECVDMKLAGNILSEMLG